MIQKNKPSYLYIHVPFCKSICAYCDFAHVVYQTNQIEQWFDAIQKELQASEISYDLKTIYIGGGTPTVLTAEQLDRLLTLLDPYASNVKEYTIEINPETLDEKKAQILSIHGVNRASVGLQTTNEKLLKLLGRHHTFQQVQDTISILKKYEISNISLDIMYSLPFQTMEMLQETVKKALTLQPKHMSLYSLTIEENTIFGKKGYTPLDEETEANMYEWIVAYLQKEGFHQYEVSNFACGNHESMHNKAYWNYYDFYGIGCGASGKINHVRYDAPHTLSMYLQDSLYKEKTVLTKEDEMFEMLMMGLRLIKGMNLALFEKRFGVSFMDVFGEKAKKQLQEGFVEIKDGYFRCTETGYEIMNTILVELM